MTNNHLIALKCYPGHYDTQRADRDGPDCRGRLRTDKDGKYSFKAVVPVAYPIPGDVSFLQLALLRSISLNIFSAGPRGRFVEGFGAT